MKRHNADDSLHFEASTGAQCQTPCFRQYFVKSVKLLQLFGIKNTHRRVWLLETGKVIRQVKQYM